MQSFYVLPSRYAERSRHASRLREDVAGTEFAERTGRCVTQIIHASPRRRETT